MRKSTIERFMKYVMPEPMSGCWLWMGAVNSKTGYGSFSSLDYPKLAHRASFILFKGTIPNDLYVCHNCDVRSCVNPEHLFLGTSKDNYDDMVNKQRVNKLRGSKHANSVLNEEDIYLLKELRLEGKTQQYIADKLGVSQSTISHVLTGGAWKHLNIINELK